MKKIKALFFLAKISGISVILIFIIHTFLRRVGQPIGYHYVLQKYISYFKKYIFERYADFINSIPEKYNEISKSTPKNDGEEPIWILWLQGLENAPKIVSICVNSVKKNAGKHPVYFIDKGNVEDYIEIPKYIWEKFETGIISHANISDFIRFNILFKHGGLWIDSTVFVSGSIPEECFKQEFFAYKTNAINSDFSNGSWTNFLLGAQPKTFFFYYMVQMFSEYWKRENFLLHYFLNDILMLVAKDKFINVKELLGGSKKNEHIFLLFDIINEKYNLDKLNEIFDKSTFHKLSYRLKKLDYNNNNSFLYYLMENNHL
jgi:hypothetical protein